MISLSRSRVSLLLLAASLPLLAAVLLQMMAQEVAAGSSSVSNPSSTDSQTPETLLIATAAAATATILLLTGRSLLSSYHRVESDDPAKAKIRQLPLPPGPKALPLVGNLLELGDFPQFAFAKWREQYGPIVCVAFGKKTAIIVSSAEILKELYASRGMTNSDRMQDSVVSKIISFDNHMPLFMNIQDERWKTSRKLMALTLAKSALLKAHQETYDMETKEFIKSIAASTAAASVSPVKVGPLAKVFSLNMILNVVMGHRVSALSALTASGNQREVGEPSQEGHDAFTSEDDLVTAYLQYVDEFFVLLDPSGNLPDYIPLLSYLPNKQIRKAQGNREKGEKYIEIMMDNVRKEVEKGIARKCLLSEILTNPQMVEGWTDMELKAFCSVLILAGVDTTSTAIQWACAILANHPEVQVKLHEELDRVVGRERLPVADDEANLVLLASTLRECQRYHPVGPIGVPHVTAEEQECQGYRIPKGSLVMMDLWGLNQQKALYGEDADQFRFDRYVGPDGLLNTALDGGAGPRQFSIGRRICPGKDLAVLEIFVAISRLLACYTILPATDGQPVDLMAMTPGITHPPKDLRLRFVKRHEGVERLLAAHASQQ